MLVEKLVENNDVQMNMEIMSLILGNEYGSTVEEINSNGKNVTFRFTDGVSIKKSVNELQYELNMIRPSFDYLLQNFYGGSAKGIRTTNNKIAILHNNGKMECIVDKKKFIEYMKLGVETQIELLCTNHNIMNVGKKYMSIAPISTLLKSLEVIKNGIKTYCPDGNPNTPVKVDIVDNNGETCLGLVEIPLYDAAKDPVVSRMYKNILKRF